MSTSPNISNISLRNMDRTSNFGDDLISQHFQTNFTPSPERDLNSCESLKAGPCMEPPVAPTKAVTGSSKVTFPGCNPDHMLNLVAKLWFDHNLESSISVLEKEEHDNRMTELRKQLDYISDTNWKFCSIDSCLGQS